MTAKEKAEELINRYLKILAGGMYDVREEAKKCALICVDEILQYIDRINEKHQGSILNDADWLKVKDELNRL